MRREETTTEKWKGRGEEEGKDEEEELWQCTILL